jgi:hypothetical protein
MQRFAVPAGYILQTVPVSGTKIITEPASPEDLPHLESDKLSNTRITMTLCGRMATYIHNYFQYSMGVRRFGTGNIEHRPVSLRFASAGRRTSNGREGQGPCRLIIFRFCFDLIVISFRQP